MNKRIQCRTTICTTYLCLFLRGWAEIEVSTWIIETTKLKTILDHEVSKKKDIRDRRGRRTQDDNEKQGTARTVTRFSDLLDTSMHKRALVEYKCHTNYDKVSDSSLKVGTGTSRYPMCVGIGNTQTVSIELWGRAEHPLTDNQPRKTLQHT